MKKSVKILIAFIASFTILFSACKSKPESKEEPKPKPQVEQKGPSQAELDAAKAAKEKEALLAELEKIQAENGALNKARKRAIELGADKAYPEKFSVPENLVASAKTDIEADKLKEALDKFHEAIDRYDTLSNLKLASDMKSEIEEKGFAKYATEDFEKAEKLNAETLENYELDYKMAKETSDEALGLYKNVVNQGYLEFAKEAKELAKEAKADCDSIKVVRSRTEEYNAAVRLFNVGKSEASEAEHKKAYLAFTHSAEDFKTLYEEVSVKRAEAEKAMEEARKKQEESSNLALEADQEAPLTEAVEGFGDGELDLEDKSSPNGDSSAEEIDTEVSEEEVAEEVETEDDATEEEVTEEETLIEDESLNEEEVIIEDEDNAEDSITEEIEKIEETEIVDEEDAEIEEIEIEIENEEVMDIDDAEETETEIETDTDEVPVEDIELDDDPEADIEPEELEFDDEEDENSSSDEEGDI